MKHHIMECLEYGPPDTILLHHGTNDLRSEEPAEKIASNIINVAFSAKNKNTVYVSGLIVRNGKYNRKGKEVNVVLKKKCNNKNLSLIDNRNINPRMLNKSGLHLN